MRINIDIEDSKAQVFVDYLKSLDLVRIERVEPGNSETNLLLDQRLKAYYSNPNATIALEDALEILKNKYSFK